MLKVIFIADIVGKIGRKAVTKYLPKLKKLYQPDLVIANAENLAHGSGFTTSTLGEMTKSGVDMFTSGNHAWRKGEADTILNADNSLVIRPANYADARSGKGYKEIKFGNFRVIVVNLLGKVFMKDEPVGCPFNALEKITHKFNGEKDIIIVDMHAETTSEKHAIAQYFDGKVTAVLGTHTHVPTADERILTNGTALISDVGMVGYYDSVIGARKDQVFNLFLGHGETSRKHDLPDTGECQFDAVYLEINAKTRKATKIKRINKIIDIK